MFLVYSLPKLLVLDQTSFEVSWKERVSNQPRISKVLAVLLVSMTAGATVLMALSGNPPTAGPFCLSSYYRLDPIEKVIKSRAAQSPNRWNSIEIYFSGTKAGNIEQLASLEGLSNSAQLNCHFLVCNGLGGRTVRSWPQKDGKNNGQLSHLKAGTVQPRPSVYVW